MVKEGGSDDEAKKLADEFQALLLEVMFEEREIKEENDIIRAKALPGTKKKEPANLPHEFVTNDDFCPGCALELKSLPPDADSSVAGRLPRRLVDSSAPRRRAAGQARPARVPRLGARALARRRPPQLRRGPAHRHQGDAARRCRRSTPTCTA